MTPQRKNLQPAARLHTGNLSRDTFTVPTGYNSSAAATPLSRESSGRRQSWQTVSSWGGTPARRSGADNHAICPPSCTLLCTYLRMSIGKDPWKKLQASAKRDSLNGYDLWPIDSVARGKDKELLFTGVHRPFAENVLFVPIRENLIHTLAF